ncbi:regulator of G protein signaling superfamily [Myriangium duriaei CBS 260.36]|uniref:Regulator of G protein signaling superfamily n=1 Tax=Myriangium duriaei CBS 260.36 TaxID=1168546 RepID=A0A9P4MJR4_9PEZI|nr:regulator of G protein signaling superfamily [Myriangium duriaei CBS 260.36]
MSGDEAVMSRPTPITVPARHANTCSAKRPSLKEILSNSSPPPWTLTAFMAYLSNNHCLETLEFTMDAARYKKHYAKIVAKSGDQTISPQSKEAANIKVLWQRLIEAYIRPNGSREINIPSEVRDPILHYDFTAAPPPPEALDIAVTKVYELMEESVLVPFLNSMSPPATASPHSCDCKSPDEPEVTSPREDRFSSKFRKTRFAKYSPPSASPTESPTIGFPPQQGFSNRKSAPVSLTTALHRNRLSNRLSPTSSVKESSQTTMSSSGDPASAPGLTDDSGYTSSHTTESIMTPPMSPPEDELALSPRSSRESGGWKKFGRLSQWKPMRKKSQQNFAKDTTESLP